MSGCLLFFKVNIFPQKVITEVKELITISLIRYKFDTFLK